MTAASLLDRLRAHPELAFEEHQASALAADRLAAWGYEVQRGLGGTGVVGTLHLIFQAAEENEGGARRMIEDGLFERFPCDAVFALHNAQQVAVITVGAVQAGEVYNIVSEQAVLKIGVRAQIERRLPVFVRAQADSYGLRCAVDYRQQYPVLVSHAEETAFARRVAVDLLGADKVRERVSTMGSEDFACMLQAVPGASGRA
ncbi:M20/M25/M40 family metallo-hydrolase [Alicycliphilus denitrificans]|uniref:M20/M25/M40 family metallo-hydrolase n=1 Tax=Alicycliphilus denitrificans TaxID=179636 RepID=A0A420KAR3_9BURK|nr:M20/M25/M40 family metallo-hydrolase [Alicycliphilus denitrificans]RKJ96280.1 M20/M25/M40 family metallo-hydrolase [Alicycliphilus denitrificans]